MSSSHHKTYVLNVYFKSTTKLLKFVLKCLTANCKKLSAVGMLESNTKQVRGFPRILILRRIILSCCS